MSCLGQQFRETGWTHQPPADPLPDPGVAGTYAYWIGDEGVKARLNLTDPRLTPPTGTATDQMKQEALRGTARAGSRSFKD